MLTCFNGPVTGANKSAIKSEIMPNQQFVNCWFGIIYRKTTQLLENLKKENYAHLLKTLFGTTILTSKYNTGFLFLLCIIDIYSKYAWVVPLKDKKVITISVFQSFECVWVETN